MPPLGPALPPPRPEPWFFEASALGGAELGGPLVPLAELVGLGVFRSSVGPLQAGLVYQGDLRASFFEGAALADLHALEASLGVARSPLGLELGLSGSAASAPWGELALGAHLGTPSPLAPLRFGVGLGGVWRADEVRGAPGLAAEARGELRVGSRARMLAWLDHRAFGERAPSLTGMGMGYRYSVLPAVGLRGAMGLWTSLGEPGSVWADQVASGEVLATLTLGAELSGPAGWSLPVVVSLYDDLTGGSPLSATARVGLSWSRASASRPPEPRSVELCLPAPGAEEVGVCGTFTGWADVPMERRADGLWCTSQVLPPGVHTYVYRVDGVVVTPTDAQMVREDEFGVRQGVLVVGR